MPSNGLGAQAVKMAATQLGKPYVFAQAHRPRLRLLDLVQW
jgi:hypothetical protein